jgi:quinol monooxygenase YgiN
MRGAPVYAYVYIWRFRVPPEHRAAFEGLYGPDGDWVRLFATSPDWLGSDLLSDADRPGTYLTLDRWTSRAAYDAFRHGAAAAWDEIDVRGEALTDLEELVGEYEARP